MDRSKIYVSTGSFRGPTRAAVERLAAAGVPGLELSGGGKHYDGLANDLRIWRSQFDLQLHNYFPPPPLPFVFNLASSNQEIRERTIACMTQAIEMSAMLGAPAYSFHAGFLADPEISALGATWPKLERTPLATAEAHFIEAVKVLAEVAEEKAVSLLVENNVLTVGTCKSAGDDVLLMASAEQIERLMSRLPSSVALLMDVAHLKVTSETLGFDPYAALNRLSPIIMAYHLSENDGTVDSNHPVMKDSWFWEALRPDAQFVTLEVSPAFGTDFRQQVELVSMNWAKRTEPCE